MDMTTKQEDGLREDAGREAARRIARDCFDSGTFLERLATLVREQTESQTPEHAEDLRRYCTEIIAPQMVELGFSTCLLENPEPGCGPALLAQRIEDPTLPTVLLYGHGDVVRGLPELWRAGLDPWRTTVEGPRIYGRGTADNKGQHLIAIEALRATLAARGKLGFNAKIFLETGEEIGSPGLRSMLREHREACAAEAFIGLDGPRMAVGAPEIVLGARGAVALDLVVRLREGAHHSGHWGGVLADPAILLAHALASIISADGRILVPGWQPESVPESVREACARVALEENPDPSPEPWWGEPGLSRAERIFTLTGAIVLAAITGQPEAPGSAIQGEARARVQLRHTVDVPRARFAPALRDHLGRLGLNSVEVVEASGDDIFPAARTDPADPWVKRIAASMSATAGREIFVIPNSSASNPSALFQEELGTPTIWIPHSYPGCAQHGPNEHALAPLLREGLDLMAGLFWDLGNPDFIARHG